MTTPADLDGMMSLRIASVVDAARGIRSFELVADDGGELPAFTPGSHVAVRVPSGELRKYSLCNDPAERQRYVITVKRDERGRGGSVSLCDEARVGDLLPTSLPDNAFPLVDDARRLLFIAGGIGITPFLSMIRSFGDLPPAPWKLYYLVRSRADTAFVDELGAPELRGQVTIHHDEGDAAKSFDLWPALERPVAGSHVYCCGPRGLMESVRDMTGHWPPSSIHFESFNEGGEVRADDTPFVIRLAKSGGAYEVPVGKTILGVLRDEAGLVLSSSCESGTCGTCRTRLLEGEADPRDMVLMPDEMASQIMICVSRAKSAELLLDL